jgi:hypothetical protein
MKPVPKIGLRAALLLPASLCLLGVHGAAWASDKEKTNDKGSSLGEAFTQTYQAGFIITARSGPCQGIVATVPVPTDWPEQSVKVVEEEKSTYAQNIRYRMLENGVKQLVLEVPKLPAGAEAKAVVTLEVKRHTILPPKNTSLFVIPEKLPRDVSVYLGPSPYIETQNAKIKSLAKEIIAGKTGAWEQVEAMYDWVRDNVKYENGPLKGALAALKDGTGDCEELTSLFIALCRVNKIPARTVWVPGHCYPEFYLQDDEGVGHWFPCQAAGTRAFGEIPETRPVLQKGDNFRVPERPKDRQRYVAEFLTGAGGKPSVKFIRELLNNPAAE